MSEPVQLDAGGTRRRPLIWFLLFALIAIPAALYLNKASTRWVPDADSRVRAARQAEAQATFESLRQEAEAHRDSAAAQSGYARALVDRGEFVQALVPAERAVSAEPDNASAQQLLGDILAPLGYRRDAAAAYQAAIKIDPNNLPAYQHLGDLMAAMGQPVEAERVYRQARARQPDAPGPMLSLAQLYMQQSKSSQVVSVLEPLLKSSDPPVAALFLTGKAGVTTGQSLRGIELLKRAVEKQPDFADAYHALGSALANQGRYTEGIAALQRAVDIAPENATYHYALGNALLSDTALPDHLDRAQAHFEASLERDPLSEWTHYYYGITLEQKGFSDSAAREYRRVLEINPEFASCYYRLGSLYRAMGRTQESKQLLAYFDRKSKSAITKVHDERRDHAAVDTAAYRFSRGGAALRAGNRETAQSEFEAALARDPQFAPARRALQSLKAGRQ